MRKIRSRVHRPKHIMYNIHIYTSNPTVYHPGRCCFHQDDIYNILCTYNNIEKNIMSIQSLRLSSNALTTKTMETYRSLQLYGGNIFSYLQVYRWSLRNSFFLRDMTHLSFISKTTFAFSKKKIDQPEVLIQLFLFLVYNFDVRL